MSRPPLIERYAERLRLSREEAQQRLFYECVPNWKRGFVRIHGLLRPRLYQADWRLVEEAGNATNYQGVLDALDRWNHRSPSVQSYARNRWHWRISGRRLLAVAVTLLKEAGEAQSAPAPGPVEVARPEPPMVPVAVESVRRLSSVAADELLRAHG